MTAHEQEDYTTQPLEETPAPERQTFYKAGIATTLGPGISSCIAKEEWKRYYYPGKTVTSKTPLFVFQYRDDAIDFLNNRMIEEDNQEIWEGYTTSLLAHPRELLGYEVLGHESHQYWDMFWNERLHQKEISDYDKKTWYRCSIPQGTQLVYDFTITLKVWDRK